MSRIVIDENKCKGCGLCTTVCPFDLIRIADRFNAKGYRPAEYVGRRRSKLDGQTLVDPHPSPINDLECEIESDDHLNPPKQCTGCANCAAMCPDVAIIVYRSRADSRPKPSDPLGRTVERQMSSPADERFNKGNGRERQPALQNTQVSKSS